MIDNSTTKPLQHTTISSRLTIPMNWQERGVGIARIIFGLAYVVAAALKWQPQFQNTFVQQISAVSDGQPAPIQAWISFWTRLVSINPLLFARIEATTETAIAVFLIFGILSNLTSIVGIFLSLGIWSTAEGFGGPYIPGQSTDIGTAFPYAILFAVLLFLSAGRYYGVDQWLTAKLGRLGFLASGSFRRSRRQG
jgi:thiosulfate dehydrogenase (quinone) large subunit